MSRKMKLLIVKYLSYLFTLYPQNVPYNEEAASKLADSILEVTTIPWEIETLSKIARYESGLKPSVTNCVIRGKLGESGIYQVWPRNNAEKIDLCSSDWTKQTRIALFRIKESKTVCERLGFRHGDILGLYTSGKCYHNNRHARLRYGDGTSLIKNDI